MVAIDIRVGGASVADHALYTRCRFATVADGNPGDAEVMIDNSDRTYTRADFRVGKTLELFIDGQREWDGWVFGLELGWPFEADDTSPPSSTPRWWTIRGIDRNMIWSRRVMYDVSSPGSKRGFRMWPAGTSDKTALLYSLNEYTDIQDVINGYDIRNVGSPSQWTEFTLGYSGAPLGTLFEDCSEVTGAVFWVGAGDRRIHYRGDRDVTAPWPLSDQPSGNQRGYREVAARLDFTKAATQALVWGAGKGSADPVFARYTSVKNRQKYGLWQWADEYVGAWKPKTVQRRARTYVEGSPSHRRGHGEPVPSVTCTLFEKGIRAGHVVDFRCELYDYQEALPVRRVQMTFPTPTDVRYDLELSPRVDMPWGVPDPWWSRTKEDPPERDPVQPDGPDKVEDPESPVIGEELIDHYDRTEGSVAREQHIFDRDWESPLPEPGIIQLEPGTVPMPDDAQPGHLAVVYLYVGQVYVGTVAGDEGVDWVPPEGWSFQLMSSAGSEDFYAAYYVLYKILDGTEEPLVIPIIGNNQSGRPGGVVAHVTIWETLGEPLLFFNGQEITWPWEEQTRGVFLGGPGVPVLVTEETPDPWGYWQGMATTTGILDPGMLSGTASVVFPAEIIEDELSDLGVTPPQNLTGSRWPGLNPYIIESENPEWGLRESTLYVRDGGTITAVLTGDSHDFDTGEVIEEATPAAWTDGPWIVKGRFRMLGPSDKYQELSLTMDVNNLTTDQVSYASGRVWYDSGAEGGNWSLDVSALEGSETVPLPLEAPTDDDWYYIMVDFGTTGWVRAKVWLEGSPEPDWQAITPFIVNPYEAP